MVLAAPAKALIDFGLRRAHGAEAGLLAARAAYLAGFAGTATLGGESRLAFRCSAPWRTPSSRRTMTRRPPSSASPWPAQGPDAADRHLRYRRRRPAGRPVSAAAGRQRRHDCRRPARQRRSGAACAQRAGDPRCRGPPSIRIMASSGLDDRSLQALSRQGAPIDSFGSRHRISRHRPMRRPSTAPTSCRSMTGGRGASSARAR